MNPPSASPVARRLARTAAGLGAAATVALTAACADETPAESYPIQAPTSNAATVPPAPIPNPNPSGKPDLSGQGTPSATPTQGDGTTTPRQSYDAGNLCTEIGRKVHRDVRKQFPEAAERTHDLPCDAREDVPFEFGNDTLPNKPVAQAREANFPIFQQENAGVVTLKVTSPNKTFGIHDTVFGGMGPNSQEGALNITLDFVTGEATITSLPWCVVSVKEKAAPGSKGKNEGLEGTCLDALPNFVATDGKLIGQSRSGLGENVVGVQQRAYDFSAVDREGKTTKVLQLGAVNRSPIDPAQPYSTQQSWTPAYVLGATIAVTSEGEVAFQGSKSEFSHLTVTQRVGDQTARLVSACGSGPATHLPDAGNAVAMFGGSRGTEVVTSNNWATLEDSASLAAQLPADRGSVSLMSIA